MRAAALTNSLVVDNVSCLLEWQVMFFVHNGYYLPTADLTRFNSQMALKISSFKESLLLYL